MAITPTTPLGQAANGTSDKNNQQNARAYQLGFIKLLNAIFAQQAYFGEAFDGGLQALDGVANNATAFFLKVNNQGVVPKSYDTTTNVGFGTGTSKTTRFGNREEIIYSQVSVPYTWDYAWHEGIDRATVNMGVAEAIADRTELQARFKVAQFNARHGKFLVENATKIGDFAGKIDGTQAAVDAIVANFDKADNLFTDAEIVGTRRAYVTSQVFNNLVNSKQLTDNSAKASGVNLATNDVYEYKGFIITKVPSQHLKDSAGATAKPEDDVQILFTIDGIAQAFTGIVTARTIESEDFDGVAFQGYGKCGEYILADNKVGLLKVTTGK